MRISESTMQLASYHAAQEAEFIEEETSREARSGRERQPIQSGIRAWPTQELPSVWMDRVDISSRAHQEVQSEYTAKIVSSSKVISGTDDRVMEFENEQLVTRVVGEVMDREVTIRTLRNGDDIRSGNDASSGVDPELTVLSNSAEHLVTRDRTQIHFEQEQMEFSSRGRVVTEDGRDIEFTLDLNMDRAFLSRTEEQTFVHTWQEKVNLVDPLVISLDGSISGLTDTRFEFDLDNDGTLEEISFVSKGSGFLSFDRNQDGKINNGSELFGPGTGNGFGELGEFDLDKNGWIDENDAVFAQLSVWTRDDQGNDVLVSLKEAGVGAVYLDNAQAEFNITTMDNELKGQVRRSGMFLFENGNVGTVQQIDLAAREPEENMSDLSWDPVSQQASPLPSVSGSGTGALAERNGETQNPFQALIDQIKVLKEEMRQILGQDSKDRNRFRGLGSKAMTFSDAQLYSMTHLDLAGRKQVRSMWV